MLAWVSTAFSLLALSMISNVGLNIGFAIYTASLPIAGRIKYCLDSWKNVTSSQWVLSVVKRGYKLQF